MSKQKKDFFNNKIEKIFTEKKHIIDIYVYKSPKPL